MPGTHPYISGAGNIAQMVLQLRKAFPPAISSETVKKLGLAPNNESYVINTLHFIGVIDAEGKKTEEAGKVFSKHRDDEFAESFSQLIKSAYSSVSEKDEQEGYKFIFSGSMMAIRNPRGHEINLKDSPTDCLDHLSLASMLARRLEKRISS